MRGETEKKNLLKKLKKNLIQLRLIRLTRYSGYEVSISPQKKNHKNQVPIT